MAVTVTEIKKRIKILVDEFATAYLSDARYTTLFSKASYRYFSKQVKKWQSTRIITERLTPLCVTAGSATVTNYVIDTTAITDYWKFQNVQPTYTAGGKTYTRWARELKANELGSVFSQGSYMYPRYVLDADAINLFPRTGTCTSAAVDYFRIPYDLDFSSGSNSVPYSLDIVDGIVLEFAEELALEIREDAMYNQLSNEENEDLE